MIFKVQPDVRQFQQFALSIDDVEDKMGEDCLIAMDSRPIAYTENWQPVELEFFDEFPGGSANKAQPDIMIDNLGHLYFSKQAYLACASALNGMGEWLPVTHQGSKAYVFNPLSKAEDVNAVDSDNTQYEEGDSLKRVAFLPEPVKNTPLFKTELDSFRGIYCLAEFKKAVEQAQLNGLIFTDDLSDTPPGMN